MNEEIMAEFLEEAEAIFEDSENALLLLEKNASCESSYKRLFRAFHSLKGAAGMFGLELMQKHMHQLESLLEQNKNQLSPSFIDYLLKGLDVAKKIVQGHEITYPMFDAKNPVVEKIEKPIILKTAREKPLIFVIDDETEIIEVVSDILEKNYQVQGFTQPKILLQHLDRLPSDNLLSLVISDYQMPDINGIDLMKSIYQSFPHMPFILMSGYLDKDICIDALSQGVSGLVDKPMKEQALLQMVEIMTQRYQAIKLLNSSIDLFMYQYHDLHQFLIKHQRQKEAHTLQQRLKELLENRDKAFKICG